jgi:RNA polymerase sigma factor (TIGR02999 family)
MARFDDIYQQLKLIARRELARHQQKTLNTTALVHEAFIKLAKHEEDLDRAHRIHLVTRVMRQITIDHARARASDKRGAGLEWVQALPRTEDAEALEYEKIDMIAFDQALGRLAEQHPRMAKVLELSFFGGVEHEEIAQMLDVTLRTVQRDLLAARTLILHELRD